jgi:hypothetical protein
MLCLQAVTKVKAADGANIREQFAGRRQRIDDSGRRETRLNRNDFCKASNFLIACWAYKMINGDLAAP